MVFDLKHLDLVRVIQALFRSSIPAGIGIAHHLIEGSEQLTRTECEELLMNGAKTIGTRSVILIDYVKGRPIKFDFVTTTGLAYATAYDTRNGKYRFLEALIEEFGKDSIVIKRKKYPPYTSFDDILQRKEQIKEWEKIMRQQVWNNFLPKN